MAGTRPIPYRQRNATGKINRNAPHHPINVFLANNSRPFICTFCDEEVTEGPGLGKFALNVHHINGDAMDHSVANLAPSHKGCHISWHKRGKKLHPEHRKAITRGMGGRVS